MPANLRTVSLVLACVVAIVSSASAEDRVSVQQLREETWALMIPLPMFAFVVRPVGGGPYPLLVMNHGISGDPEQRTFFSAIEYRDAARWFARQGYFVVSPVRYGAISIDRPEEGLFSLYFASVGSCDKPNFRGPGLMIATLDQWVIDFMQKEATVAPGKVIVVGQSGGGWGAIALSSLNPSSVQAIITFAAGRGGRVDGKPNNNCAPDKLVEATRNRRSNAQFRQDIPHPNAVDLRGERHIFWPGLGETNARGVYSSGRESGISDAPAVWKRRSFLDRWG
jgi:dienelactone hydrolase